MAGSPAVPEDNSPHHPGTAGAPTDSFFPKALKVQVRSEVQPVDADGQGIRMEKLLGNLHGQPRL
jgi:hypothetical protein